MSRPRRAINVNLTGDNAVWYDVICHRNGKTSEISMSKADVTKNGMKFVRS